MPQGKGTYGSKKGRPPKKKKARPTPKPNRKGPGTATRSVLSQSVTRRYPEKAAKANARAKAGKGKGGRGKPSRGGIKKKRN